MMRRTSALFSLCLFLALALCPAAGLRAAEPGPSGQLDVLARAMDARTTAMDELRDLDAEQLRARVAGLRRTLADENAKLDKAVAELDGLRARRTILAEEYDTAAADMHAVEDAVRSNASQAASLLADSARTSFDPARIKPLERLSLSSRFPAINEIAGLGALLLDEIRSGATAEVRGGTFLGPDGAARQGKLLRGGSLFLGGVDGSGEAFLLTPGSMPPAAVAHTPGATRDAIADWADGSGGVLPLDPAHGAALSLLQARRTLDDWLQGGGMLLWPILAIGLLAALAVLYKGARLLAVHPSPRDFPDRLRQAWETGRWPGVEAMLRALPKVPVARVLLRADPDVDPKQRDKQLQEGFLFELRRLESLLGFIAVMAAVAPLLGLLGTVTGMIDSFQAITVFGTSNPRIMSGGISEALITTQAGLGVAIPAMLLHQFLKQRVQVLAGDMEQQCAAFQALLAGGASGEDA